VAGGDAKRAESDDTVGLALLRQDRLHGLSPSWTAIVDIRVDVDLDIISKRKKTCNY
jgi:hypothetical protein